MDKDATFIETTQPPPVVVPARVEPLLADLAEARSIAMRFLRRMDEVAEAMTPEEQKAALAEDGQLVLNVTRMDRALRQIGVLEEEVMGRRVSAAGRGMMAGGPGSRGSGGDGRGRHDFNDLNDLNDLDDLRDEVFALFDPDDLFDQEAYADFASIEAHDTFKKYQKNRKHDFQLSRKLQQMYDGVIADALDEIAAERERTGYVPEGEPKTIEEIAEMEREVRKTMTFAEAPDPLADAEEKWRARRDAILRLRAAEKRHLRSGRGPPGG
jgi:hypothetical protein